MYPMTENQSESYAPLIQAPKDTQLNTFTYACHRIDLNWIELNFAYGIDHNINK